jgi:adenylate cyclase
MDEVYELLIHEVHRYEGTVNQVMGDGIMALFGVPITHEDDPARALKSAQVMLYKLHEFNRAHPELPKPLQMRIGINTGVAVAGNVGSAGRTEYTVIGDSINMLHAFVAAPPVVKFGLALRRIIK